MNLDLKQLFSKQFLVLTFLSFRYLEFWTKFLSGERLDRQIRCTTFHMCVRSSHLEVFFFPRSLYYEHWLRCSRGKGYSQRFFPVKLSILDICRDPGYTSNIPLKISPPSQAPLVLLFLDFLLPNLCLKFFLHVSLPIGSWVVQGIVDKTPWVAEERVTES